jgi:hypothetical protein
MTGDVIRRERLEPSCKGLLMPGNGFEFQLMGTKETSMFSKQ